MYYEAFLDALSVFGIIVAIVSIIGGIVTAIDYLDTLYDDNKMLRFFIILILLSFAITYLITIVSFHLKQKVQERNPVQIISAEKQ